MTSKTTYYCNLCGREFIETKQMKETISKICISSVGWDEHGHKYYGELKIIHKVCTDCMNHFYDGIENKNWGIFKSEEVSY